MKDILSNISTDDPIVLGIMVLVAIVIIVSVLKALFRVAMIVAGIGIVAVIFFGMNPDDVIDKGKELATVSTEFVQENVKPTLIEGLKASDLKLSSDGSSLKGEDVDVKKSDNGEYEFSIKSMDLSFSQDELAEYLSKDEMRALLEQIEEKAQEIQ